MSNHQWANGPTSLTPGGTATGPARVRMYDPPREGVQPLSKRYPALNPVKTRKLKRPMLEVRLLLRIAARQEKQKKLVTLPKTGPTIYHA